MKLITVNISHDVKETPKIFEHNFQNRMSMKQELVCAEGLGGGSVFELNISRHK